MLNRCACVFYFLATLHTPLVFAQANVENEATEISAPAVESKTTKNTTPSVEVESTEEPAKSIEAATIQVEWYQPEAEASPRKGMTRVLISGKTLPGTRVSIPQKKIPVLTKKQEVKYLNVEKILVEKKTVANKKGEFGMQIDLPNSTVQLPIQLTTRAGASKNYQLNLAVNRDEIKLKSQKDLKKSPIYFKRYGVDFGTGFNFLQYAQSSAETESDLEFQSFKGPSYFLRGWMWLNDRWDINLSLKMSPGEVASAEDPTGGGISISQGSYNWMIYAVEGNFYPPTWVYNLFGKYRTQAGIPFGLQHHIVPFISRTGASETEAEIKTNSLTMLTAGYKMISLYKKWNYEFFMRYQYPLMTGEVFDISPQFAFDGSLGAAYKLPKDFRLGLYWYGQWHQYAFTHHDKYLDTDVTGNQVLFFSNIEIRIGYLFN